MQSYMKLNGEGRKFNLFDICIYLYVFYYHYLYLYHRRWFDACLGNCQLCDLSFICVFNPVAPDVVSIDFPGQCAHVRYKPRTVFLFSRGHSSCYWQEQWVVMFVWLLVWWQYRALPCAKIPGVLWILCYSLVLS